MSIKAFIELRSLSPSQRLSLERGGIKSIDALLLNSPTEISKKAKISLNEAQVIVRRACEELSSPNLGLSSLRNRESVRCTFTTGDAMIDRTIGGGMRTGMVWDFFGEGASGKTQLALQLSLFVQLPEELGGLCGAACYLSTFSALPTKRLLQMIEEHPRLSTEHSSLSDIHSLYTPTNQLLMHALSALLPNLLESCRKDRKRKPIRLLVIDSLSELYRSSPDRNANSLFERSKELHELSNALHKLCADHNVAVIVVSGVTDVFSHEHATTGDSDSYRQQSRWFSRAHSLPAEYAKEAGLGLVWANQVNARVMFTRTNRRRLARDIDLPEKRIRLQDGSAAPPARNTHQDAGFTDDDLQQSMHIRRLSVVFSSVSSPSSVDYVITRDGVSAVSDIFTPILEDGAPTTQSNRAPGHLKQGDVAANPTLLSSDNPIDGDLEEDEDDSYWNLFDEIQEDLLPDVEESILEEGCGYDTNVDEDIML